VSTYTHQANITFNDLTTVPLVQESITTRATYKIWWHFLFTKDSHIYVYKKAKHVTILASIKAAWYTNKGFD